MTIGLKDRLAVESILRAKTNLNRLQKPVVSRKVSDRLHGELFELQREILDHPAKRKALLAGRRASKTYLLTVALIRRALDHPGSTCLFIALTRRSAKRLIWQQLKIFSQSYSLGAVFNHTELTATFPNGSKILCGGCETQSEAEKYRGDHYHLACVDEAASFGSHLRYLIDEVLEPALADFDGELWLAGTPNAACAGAFYDITTAPIDWSVWHFTVLDNPMFPRWAGYENWKERAASWFAAYRRSKGWADDNPVLRREWLAEWVRDTDSLVLDYSDARNTYTELPERDWRYVLGIDIGFNDEFVIAACAYSLNDPNFYVVDVFKQAQMLSDDKAAIVAEWDHRYQPVMVVADPGGGGRQFIEDVNNKYRLNIEAAHKQDRPAFIAQVNDDFRTGRIKLHADLTEVISELKLMQWKNQAKGQVDPRFKKDAFDAIRYAWRESEHSSYLPPAAMAKRTEADSMNEYWAAMEETIREEERETYAQYYDLN